MKLTPADYPIGSRAPNRVGARDAARLKIRVATGGIAVLFLVLVLAAALVPIGGAVLGGGQLGVESRVKRIAHPTGGVISEIRVRDGMRVKRGQLLLRLDTTVSGVRADLSHRTVDQLVAQQARLQAERESAPGIRFPPELLRQQGSSAQAAMAAEQRLFVLRANERRGLRAQLNERISQLNAQIGGYRAQIAALRQQQVLIEPERKSVQELWEKELVTISRRNQLERTAVDLGGSIAALEASIAQAGGRISETREQIIQLDQTARSQAATELTQINTALNEQQVQNVSAGDVFDRSAIRAPYDGVVDKLAFAAIGDVVQPAEPIMEIVPDSDRLVLEAGVRPSDIDQVRIGQRARVRFSAFNSTATPEVPGRVVFVSAERVTEKDSGTSFYRVRVEADAEAVKRSRLRLVAGMPAEVLIPTESRSMLSYLIKPLRDQFAHAFRD